MKLYFTDPGEGILEGIVVSILVRPGDLVSINQPLLEIETVKTIVEIPSPIDGILLKWEVQEMQTITTGQVLCHLKENEN